MTEPVKIRAVTTGTEPKWELVVDGLKVRALSYLEVHELVVSGVSSLRYLWEKRS